MAKKKETVEKTAVNFLMRTDLKNEWTEICEELGMSISGAITLLAKQMVRERKLPFTPDASKTDLTVKNNGPDLMMEQSGNQKDTEILLQCLRMLQKEKEDKE